MASQHWSQLAPLPLLQNCNSTWWHKHLLMGFMTRNWKQNAAYYGSQDGQFSLSPGSDAEDSKNTVHSILPICRSVTYRKRKEGLGNNVRCWQCDHIRSLCPQWKMAVQCWNCSKTGHTRTPRRPAGLWRSLCSKQLLLHNRQKMTNG